MTQQFGTNTGQKEVKQKSKQPLSNGGAANTGPAPKKGSK